MNYFSTKILLLLFLFSYKIGVGQVFQWKNPNLKDSLKKDSILKAKINNDFFQKDTINFVKKRSKILIDEAVLVKPIQKNMLGNLEAKGSILRGITFGNNQGSAVQSTMDFQIKGKISKDVSILAHIFDNNLPIQADGYTQTLEDFDRIYIQLGIKQYTFLRAGHIDLSNTETHFGKFQRRSMGLEFQTKLGNTNFTNIHLSAGVARSEFHRMRFQGIEGNQGPYRLLGKNGEVFITIISGSEQVFIDGILMKRGENNDYTINYNTGEVVFMSKRPIYKQNFITVSYNYTNRNYNRYLLTGGIHHQREKFKMGINWFWENDDKSTPLALNLSKEDEKILANAGNDVEKMYAPSGVVTEYDENKILYRLVQRTEGAYYEYSNNALETLYQVVFTYFGERKGDYRLKQSINNGRIFEFVGKNMGSYSAVRKLPSPQKTQVLSANVEYALSEGKIGADASLSYYNINLFSSKNKQDNLGYAGRIFGNKLFRKNQWEGIPSVEYQYINNRFHILDRINDVEFARDFNLNQEFNQKTQHRLILGFINRWENRSKLNYKLNYLEEKNNYKGIKNDLDWYWRKDKFITDGYFSYLNTRAGFQDTKFIRVGAFVELLGKKGNWKAGISSEYNRKYFHEMAKLDVTSFGWKEAFIQKKIGDSVRNKLLTKMYLRTNDSVRMNRLEKINDILGLVLESQLVKTEKSHLSTEFHYRKFYYKNQEIRNDFSQNFIIGNIKYNQYFFHDGMRFQAFYELGNGQEAQREFQYLKVTDGQGVYKWTDYNNDGVQQLDEFEVAEYQDLAQYIRIYTNAVKYLPSNKNKLQFSLLVNPSVMFSSENRFLKRWNFNLSLSSQNSFLKGNKALIINPFHKSELQILKNQNLLASVQFTPTNQSGWGGSYRFMFHHHLINANFSNEAKIQSFHTINMNYRFSKSLSIDWENQVKNIENTSQIFASRDYILRNLETKPKIIYRISEGIQSEFFSSFKQKKRIDGVELLKTIDFTGTLQWAKNKTSIRGNFSLIYNTFEGNSFSIVGNQMLEGLKVGRNQVWTLSLQQAISSFIHLNINYEGRNSGERIIHIGGMQLKANF